MAQCVILQGIREEHRVNNLMRADRRNAEQVLHYILLYISPETEIHCKRTKIAQWQVWRISRLCGGFLVNLEDIPSFLKLSRLSGMFSKLSGKFTVYLESLEFVWKFSG